jgi:hypothetical protein
MCYLQLSVIRSDRTLNHHRLSNAGSILDFKMAAALCPKTLEHIQVNFVGIHSLNT